MKITATCLAIAAALALVQVNAHGGMIKPKPRALTTMGLAIDSTFGHPITMRGDYTKGKGGDCIGFTADANLQTIPVGTSKISMRANDGANHIGPCTVSLVDPQDKSNKLQVGQMKDCMRSLHPGPGAKGDQPIPAEMTITVPAGSLPCRDGHCVLEFEWEAQHVTPYEHYNNCADVKITGGGSSSGGEATAAPAATPTATKTPVGTTKAPKPTTQAPTTKPSASSGTKGSYVGSTADMTTWCNWNCPQFCPEDLCKLAK